MVFFMLCMLAGDVVWQFDRTDIYRDLNPTQMAIGPKGSVYLADPDQCHILLISPPGNLIKKIGRKGNGPGEFIHLYQIFFDQQRLFAYDNQQDRLSVFEPDGTFIQAIRVPKRRVRLLRIPGGWLIGDWQKVGESEDDGKLFRADDAMEGLVEILRLPGPFYHGGLRVSRNEPGKAFFTPFSAKPLMRLSLDRQYAYVSDAHQFAIYVIATADGRLVRTLKQEENNIPMDRDWVNAEMAAMKSELEGQVEAKMVANAPDHFPAIRNFWTLPSEDLVVELWQGKPDDRHLLVGLSPNGGLVEDPPAWRDINSLKQSTSDRSYYLIWQSDREEFGLVVKRVPDGNSEE